MIINYPFCDLVTERNWICLVGIVSFLWIHQDDKPHWNWPFGQNQNSATLTKFSETGLFEKQGRETAKQNKANKAEKRRINLLSEVEKQQSFGMLTPPGNVATCILIKIKLLKGLKQKWRFPALHSFAIKAVIFFFQGHFRWLQRERGSTALSVDADAFLNTGYYTTVLYNWFNDDNRQSVTPKLMW